MERGGEVPIFGHILAGEAPPSGRLLFSTVKPRFERQNRAEGIFSSIEVLLYLPRIFSCWKLPDVKIDLQTP